MKNKSGVVVVAVVFIGLFALILGAFVGHRHPKIFSGPSMSTDE